MSKTPKTGAGPQKLKCVRFVFIAGRTFFFPQHLVEGLLNSRRRMSDRPGWILIFKTPARKPTNIVVFFLVPVLGTQDLLLAQDDRYDDTDDDMMMI